MRTISKYFSESDGVVEVKYKLQDLVDLNRIREMFVTLYQISDIPLSIVDNEGNVLVVTHQQDICECFHRADVGTYKHCVESDHYLAEHYNGTSNAIVVNGKLKCTDLRQ